jgi:hypothetical protein
MTPSKGDGYCEDDTDNIPGCLAEKEETPILLKGIEENVSSVRRNVTYMKLLQKKKYMDIADIVHR